MSIVNGWLVPLAIATFVLSERTFNETFDDTSGGQGVLLEFHFVTNNKCVGLHEEFARLQHVPVKLREHLVNDAYQFFLQYDIPDFSIPARKWVSQLSIELPCAGTICCALADLKLHQKFTYHFSPSRQNCLSVDLVRSTEFGT